MTAANLPTLLQSFFTDRLMQQRRASPNTIASYRDTFRLLLRFAVHRLGKSPSKLELEQLTRPSSRNFSSILKKAAAAPHAPETPGLLLSDPSLDTWR